MKPVTFSVKHGDTLVINDEPVLCYISDGIVRIDSVEFVDHVVQTDQPQVGQDSQPS